jgi:hypothetical protein
MVRLDWGSNPAGSLTFIFLFFYFFIFCFFIVGGASGHDGLGADNSPQRFFRRDVVSTFGTKFQISIDLLSYISRFALYFTYL